MNTGDELSQEKLLAEFRAYVDGVAPQLMGLSDERKMLMVKVTASFIDDPAGREIVDRVTAWFEQKHGFKFPTRVWEDPKS